MFRIFRQAREPFRESREWPGRPGSRLRATRRGVAETRVPWVEPDGMGGGRPQSPGAGPERECHRLPECEPREGAREVQHGPPGRHTDPRPRLDEALADRPDLARRPRGVAAMARLQQAWPTLVPVHTPIHASWLNQIEIYFSVVQRKVLTPNDFTSLAAVEDRLGHYLENRSRPKKHNDRMEAALQQARAVLPEDASEADEGNLIDVILLARKLRRDLRAAGLEPPEDEWSTPPSG